MTKIIPFRALRPVKDKVHLVAAKPNHAYTNNLLIKKLKENPYSFLHIIHPEIGVPSEIELNAKKRFQLVSEKYQEFIGQGILFQDMEAHVYIYRQTVDSHEFIGIIAGASVEEYNQDLIKKHEATITSREQMFVDYLDIVGYNAEPVLLAYPHDTVIENLLNQFILQKPEYDFTTNDRIKHELWVLDHRESKLVEAAFETVNATYIADGHHRSASSSGLLNRRRTKGNSEFLNEHFFLSFLIEENRLKILEFNRLVKTMNGLSELEFLNRLTASFDVAKLEKACKPSKEHQITMCLSNNWYELNCKAEIIAQNHPVNRLDAAILTNYVLDPILGIKDLKTDQNIEFISGVEPIESIEKSIRQGQFLIGFMLFPVSMNQIKNVADNHMIMPPKSTWVEPKLRSGLTIYHINE